MVLIFGHILFILLPKVFAKEQSPAELTLKDASGKRVHLSDYRGKLVVLNFWATWCIPCQKEAPLMVKYEREYRDRGVVFVGVSTDDKRSIQNVPAYLRKFQIEYPIWYGAQADHLDKLNMGPAHPTTAFIDRDGHIVARVWGLLREEELKERLDWLTGERSGPQPQAMVKHLEGAREFPGTASKPQSSPNVPRIPQYAGSMGR